MNTATSVPAACPPVDPLHPPQYEICGAAGDPLDLWLDFENAGSAPHTLYYSEQGQLDYYAIPSATVEGGADAGSFLFEAEMSPGTPAGIYHYDFFMHSPGGYSDTYTIAVTVVE